MSNSRRQWVVVGFLFVLTSAGCLGFITGSGSLSFHANETVASDDALAETGYQLANNETLENTVNVSVANQQRQADVTSHLVSYNRSIDLAPPASANESVNATMESGMPDGSAQQAATVTVLSTPSATIAGQSVNPLSRLSPREFIERFSGGDESNEFQFEENRSVRSLGEQRTLTTFRTNAGDGENATDVLVHVSTFDTGDEYVAFVAVHPARLDEVDRVVTLLEGLEQPDA